MLTMNYKDLQYKYSKPKKGKQNTLANENYKLTKYYFTASTWKDYKDWLKEQELKQKLQEKAQKRLKKKKCKTTKAKGKKLVKTSGTEAKRKPMTYEEQLKDERWLKKRKQVLDTKGYVCANCGKTVGLQVHHLEYKHGKLAWEYPMSNFVVLCETCHKKIHNLI